MNGAATSGDSGRAAPVLVADIGGTNARFALAVVDDAGATTFTHRQTFRAEHYEHIADAAHAYIESWDGPRPARGAFAVAGPTNAHEIRFTNSPWAFRRDELARALALSDFRVINDFEAQARGVRRMPPESCVALKAGVPKAGAPTAVLGPGTGLGLSLLVPVSSADPTIERAIATEGGHAAFAPQTEKEIGVLAFIKREHQYVSYERLLSGRGLVNIHRALCALAGTTRVTLTPSEITEAAISERLPIAVEAVSTFCDILGAFAGDAVLMAGARGGVYIAGGIAPKILPILKDSGFESRFRGRGPMSAYMDNIPVHVLVSDEAAFYGAASAVAAQEEDRAGGGQGA